MADTSAIPHEAGGGLLSGYAPQSGVADELFCKDGAMRAVWRPFINALGRLDRDEVTARFARGDRYLHDAGVFFRQYSSDPQAERAWPLSHVPVILAEAEWTEICRGLAERADLLERVCADLYGPNRLVSDGHLPAELIANNREWLRPMVGVQPRPGKYLHALAFEIGRSPDGSWFVLGDRTQAPSGAGFALENRVANARIYAGMHQHDTRLRLSGFLRDFREAIDNLRAQVGGRSAILTPGAGTDTYFEHMYIARYLGLLLLEGEDLVVRNNCVMVRTVTGPKPIGVLWRRLDAGYADPLELDETSQIGTPGLVEAVRKGGVSMVNALGAGVLETRVLMAFLPRISRVLTGKPLTLPNIATWWCGSAKERAYVLANARRMMIGSALACDLPFDLGALTALGGTLGGGASDSVERWIEEDGARLVGQEAVTLSTTPAWDGTRLVPRPMTVRVFAARTAQGWSFMPGGYARIGSSDDVTALAMQRGGAVSDVWIVSDRPLPPEPAQMDQPFRRSAPGFLPSRAADNLFWLGRYVERAEGIVRLLRAYHLRLAETGNAKDARLSRLADYLGGFDVDVAIPVPDALLSLLNKASGCAGKVRDRFSVDGWSALQDVTASLKPLQASTRPGDDCARAMTDLLRGLTGFTGLVHENMYHSLGWQFMSMGRALERGDAMASALAVFADIGTAAGGFDIAVELGDSVMTHHRRYRVETTRDTVIDLLALDDDNPRSILFQVNRMRMLASELPFAEVAGRPGQLMRAILTAQTSLTVADPSDITTERLAQLRAELAGISRLLLSVHAWGGGNAI